MEAGGNPFDVSVDVELRGLSIYTHHGVSDAEQEIGQRLEFDVTFDVPDCDAVLTDRVEDTIDYGDVADIVALAATERSYRTLERLLSPDLFVVGGGVSKHSDKYLPLLEIDTPIVPAQLRNTAGIVGAAVLAAEA